jgi:hypothetical protein
MKTKTYTIEEFGIVVEVEDGGGSINSNLKESRPALSSVDDSLEGIAEFGQECREIDEYNSMMDAIESMILAHACEGIDVSSEAYVNGLRTAVEACGNNV